VSVSDFFANLFQPEEAESVATMRLKASEFVLAERTPFFERLMEYLDEEADKPVKIGSDMIESAVRANTFKEIRAKLRRDLKEAHAILNEARNVNS
jgi:hypothetical protein